jgi:hypothetical protein
MSFENFEPTQVDLNASMSHRLAVGLAPFLLEIYA